jgi:hypothetical protein
MKGKYLFILADLTFIWNMYALFWKYLYAYG